MRQTFPDTCYEARNNVVVAILLTIREGCLALSGHEVHAEANEAEEAEVDSQLR